MEKSHTIFNCAPINFFAQAGVTLIELMLASALGSFLLLGLVGVNVSLKTSSNLQNAISTLQENGEFTVHFLKQNIQMAGYKGCESNPPFTDQNLAIQGYRNILPDFLRGKVLANTDSIVVGLCKKENGTLQFNRYAYFIGATTRKNILGKTIYGLYEEPIDGEKRELVSDMENLQIRYGIASENSTDIENYVSADQVSDWQRVKSVDIAFSLISENPIYPKAHSYTFINAPMPADRFLHGEGEIYVYLRER